MPTIFSQTWFGSVVSIIGLVITLVQVVLAIWTAVTIGKISRRTKNEIEARSEQRELAGISALTVSVINETRAFGSGCNKLTLRGINHNDIINSVRKLNEELKINDSRLKASLKESFSSSVTTEIDTILDGISGAVMPQDCVMEFRQIYEKLVNLQRILNDKMNSIVIKGNDEISY